MKKTITWLTLFSIAMGFLETAVVVYLRVLYYPNGFTFPIVPTSHLVLKTELLRELATIIMLATMGYLAGKTRAQRFAYFIYSFAIWDLFYYVFLKMLLNWPASLFDWDILFLLPIPWIGPVLAPCLVALTLIALATLILNRENKGLNIKLSPSFWLLLFSGCSIIIFSFMLEYLMLGLFDLKSEDSKLNMLEKISNHHPAEFNWLLFCAGQLLLIVSLLLVFHQKQKRIQEPHFI